MKNYVPKRGDPLNPWPEGWTIPRIVQHIDWERRDRDPKNPAPEIPLCRKNVISMVERLRAENGTELADLLLFREKTLNDRGVKDLAYLEDLATMLRPDDEADNRPLSVKLAAIDRHSCDFTEGSVSYNENDGTGRWPHRFRHDTAWKFRWLDSQRRGGIASDRDAASLEDLPDWVQIFVKMLHKDIPDPERFQELLDRAQQKGDQHNEEYREWLVRKGEDPDFEYESGYED